MFIKKCFHLLEYWYWKNNLSIQRSTRVSLRARIISGSNIRIGSHTRIYEHAILDCSGSTFGQSSLNSPPPNGEITIGNNTTIRMYACLFSYGGIIRIGNNCSLNPFSIIYGQGNVIIGDYVRIAAHCVIVSSNHIFEDLDIPICFQGVQSKGVIIEDDVWIGAGVKILDGVRIHSGAVIAAGSVVTNDVPPLSIYGGIPARLIDVRGNSKS